MRNIYAKKNDIAKTIDQKIDQGSEKLKTVAHNAQKRVMKRQKQVEDLIGQADEQLRENPWPTVAAVAAGCLFLGFIAGKSR